MKISVFHCEVYYEENILNTIFLLKLEKPKNESSFELSRVDSNIWYRIETKLNIKQIPKVERGAANNFSQKLQGHQRLNNHGGTMQYRILLQQWNPAI